MLRQASLLLCLAVAALLAIGLTILASTSAWVHGIEEPYLFLRRQVIMAGIGLVLAIAATRVSPEWLRKYSLWMLAFVSVLLALCFVPGIGVETLGSKRWVQFPLLPQFQPSEVAKLATIIALASWFARWQSEVHSFWRGFVMPGILAGVPLLLIAAETDVGTALTLAMVVAGLLFCMGTRLRYLVPTALLAICGVGYYIYNNPVRWSRVIAWWDLENPIYQADKGMQQWRSLLALGNGGPWGAGLGNGIEKFGTLTIAHIDFIFPVVGEELGLPATLGVVLCFVLIAVAGIGIAVQATQVFNRCLALGITCLIVVPSIQNIAVTTAVLPNDGLPLPFVSYGGTSLVFSLAAIGLLVGIHRRSQCELPQEFPLNHKTRLAVRL